MRMVDLITKKKLGKSLSKNEIEYIVNGFTSGDIPRYQMSAFLMAVYFKKMNDEETKDLTMSMAESGDIVDLSQIKGIKVDKHSTGGVGDKTTLIISPIVASFGIPIAKMSGRGLGHTGGTVDKLESIPNLRTEFSKDEFINIVQKTGICLAGQSQNLAPADKKIYALRDTTSTVDDISLIASSIMSKKLASGSDKIVLDVKFGSGAFMKTYEEAKALACQMVNIGRGAGIATNALITNMDIPLGNAIGNSLEIIEAIETINGNGPSDLVEICTYLIAEMLYLGEIDNYGNCLKIAKDSFNGRGMDKLIEMVEAQGGDSKVLKNTNRFPKANIIKDIKSKSEGFISKMNAEEIGIASSLLGAGREKEDSIIDLTAGIYLHKKQGDYVKSGDILATFHTSTEDKIEKAEEVFIDSLGFSDDKIEKQKLILDRISQKI